MFLKAEANGKEETFDDCLLCITQIVSCIQCLERTIKAESSGGIILAVRSLDMTYFILFINCLWLQPTRQHFLDRIVWCLAKTAKSISECRPKGDTRLPKSDQSNFVLAMDQALDMIGPLTMFAEHEQGRNSAAVRAEVMIESANIRTVINSLIGHALSLANVALHADRKPITSICQLVLRECIAFEGVASLDQSTVADDSQRQLRATGLENSLYHLDGLVNDSLLRLVYATFVEMRKRPLDLLAEMVECQAETIDDRIAQFDEMTDRLQQIGVFAAAFAPNQQGQLNNVR